MRFVYIADSHIGAGAEGYRQQPRYADHLPELAAHLDAWIRRAGDIDFVLHGGDIVDATSTDNIRAARELFRLSVPVYLCLGNHDLTEADALDAWLAGAPVFFPDRSPVFTIHRPACAIHVLPTQWCDVPYFWREEQRPHFLPGSLESVGDAIAARPDVVHLLCTHADVMGVPPEQTGFPAVYHPPQATYTQTWVDFVQRWPQVRGEPPVRRVFAAHNHINSHVTREGVRWITASAFSETPFEFKVVEVTPDAIRMTTHNLVAKVSFTARYDFDKTFVQGRRIDRECEIQLL